MLSGSDVAGQADVPKKPVYSEDCMVWENATRHIEQEPNVAVTCVKNGPCTGLDCAGVYSYHVSSIAARVSLKNGGELQVCQPPSIALS